MKKDNSIGELKFSPESRHEKKYESFYRMCLKIRQDVNNGCSMREINLGYYASMYKCTHVYQSQLDRILKAETFSREVSDKIRDEITELSNNQRIERMNKKVLKEEDCISFLKSKGYKIMKRVDKYEEC